MCACVRECKCACADRLQVRTHARAAWGWVTKMVAPSFMEGEGLVSMYGMDTAAVKFIFADTEKVLNFISLFIRDLKVSLSYFSFHILGLPPAPRGLPFSKRQHVRLTLRLYTPPSRTQAAS